MLMRKLSLSKSIVVFNAFGLPGDPGGPGGELMAATRFDASGGGADRDREGAKRLEIGMLRASGELGFKRVSPGDVEARSGGSGAPLEAWFPSLQACFERAYATESQLLCNRILRAGAEQRTWREGLHAALLELGRYVADQPAIAKALLVEVHVAGGNAFTCRSERIERLSRALDSARREIESRHSPPPLTALFMVSAIEAAVVSSLLRGEPAEFPKVLAPELEQLVLRAYFAD